MAQTLRERWDAIMRRDLPDLEAMLKDTAPRGGRNVEYAITLLAYQYGTPIAMEYARRGVEELAPKPSLQAEEQALAAKPDRERVEEIRLIAIQSGKAANARNHAYAQLIANGTWDAARLREAIDEYEGFVARVEPRRWDVPHQWDLHSGAVAALVAGDFARAASLLANKRSFKKTEVYHAALKRLAADIARYDGALPANSEEAQAFERFFDIFRQPEPNATQAPLGEFGVDDLDIRRFEFALIKERCVTGNTGTPDLRRVFESICPPPGAR